MDKKIINYYLMCSSAVKRNHILKQMPAEVLTNYLILNKKYISSTGDELIHVKETIIGGNEAPNGDNEQYGCLVIGYDDAT